MRTLIIGSSGGIGAALLAASGQGATGLSRSQHGLDITDEASIAAHLGALEPTFDRIIIATGALELNGARPEKSLRALDPAAMSAQFALNAMGPALVLKHALRLIPRGAPAQIVALSARVGSIGDNALGGWHSYRAAKAAQNQLLRTLALEWRRRLPLACVTLLHPGTTATALSEPFRAAVAAPNLFTAERAARHLLDVLEHQTPDTSGSFLAWDGQTIPW